VGKVIEVVIVSAGAMLQEAVEVPAVLVMTVKMTAVVIQVTLHKVV